MSGDNCGSSLKGGRATGWNSLPHCKARRAGAGAALGMAADEDALARVGKHERALHSKEHSRRIASEGSPLPPLSLGQQTLFSPVTKGGAFSFRDVRDRPAMQFPV